MLPVPEIEKEFRNAGFLLLIGFDGNLNVFPASKRNDHQRRQLELLVSGRHPEMKRYLMSITTIGEE